MPFKLAARTHVGYHAMGIATLFKYRVGPAGHWLLPFNILRLAHRCRSYSGQSHRNMCPDYPLNLPLIQMAGWIQPTMIDLVQVLTEGMVTRRHPLQSRGSQGKYRCLQLALFSKAAGCLLLIWWRVQKTEFYICFTIIPPPGHLLSSRAEEGIPAWACHPYVLQYAMQWLRPPYQNTEKVFSRNFNPHHAQWYSSQATGKQRRILSELWRRTTLDPGSTSLNFTNMQTILQAPGFHMRTEHDKCYNWMCRQKISTSKNAHCACVSSLLNL